MKLKLERSVSGLQDVGVTIKLPQDITDNRLSCFGLLQNCFLVMLIRLASSILGTAKVVMRGTEEAARGLNFDFKFKNGKLEIAPLYITKTTKAKWCSVIAWEHHLREWKISSTPAYPYESTTRTRGKFTFAALIFNDLISSVDDVQLLKDKSIIVDHVRMSNDELEAFFRTISFGVDPGVVDSDYIKKWLMT